MDSIKDMQIEMAALQYQVNDLEQQLNSIVRCKDCKYWNKSDNAVWCRRTAIGIFRMEEEDFCSKGEKR